eukprot:m51a1_g7283 hypothetical protein (262) ;mRNA; f:26610-27907
MEPSPREAELKQFWEAWLTEAGVDTRYAENLAGDEVTEVLPELSAADWERLHVKIGHTRIILMHLKAKAHSEGLFATAVVGAVLKDSGAKLLLVLVDEIIAADGSPGPGGPYPNASKISSTLGALHKEFSSRDKGMTDSGRTISIVGLPFPDDKAVADAINSETLAPKFRTNAAHAYALACRFHWRTVSLLYGSLLVIVSQWKYTASSLPPDVVVVHKNSLKHWLVPTLYLPRYFERMVPGITTPTVSRRRGAATTPQMQC